ncbi:MAG: hypothetical protein P4L87_13030 [Formivibrio sp.]|nr:hypothetical protein [Formivibrio sp.]
MSLQNYVWQDVYLIRSNLIGLVAAILVAGSTLLLTQEQVHTSRSQLRPLQEQLDATHSIVQSARSAWHDAQANQQRYHELEQYGMLGQGEHRLEWVEKLTAIQQANPAYAMHYRIEPQRPLEYAKPAGNSALYSSRMTLSYRALHEGDFSRVHHALSQISGALVATRCNIDRPREPAARLIVECDYDWLSIAPSAIATGKTGVTP